ncbi:ELM1/GtrOC1 family putative glycosyltransferase [uncultured Cohaesibacter sp.]|uniref:ELM1/GtrOC1 family putative glycosyltransferase n=1 Tax=uncultured Cohaesibacter sp. TaxID=1002546 RepID=UPI0029C614C6|nr:ELM1/GtrOC1 family putative glycosyltransferase [uncultured Cohaesibacter sp.]
MVVASGMKLWIFSDGKAGDENQCLSVAERLGGTIEIRRVAPKAPWVWMMPHGPIPPGDRPSNPASPLHGPFPDVAIASGRRTVAYLRKLKQLSPTTLTVFLKDPRSASLNADLVWVPFHDKRRDAKTIVTLTGPTRLTSARLREARIKAPQSLLHLPTPRVALILGGDTAKEKFGEKASRRLAHYLAHDLPAPHVRHGHAIAPDTCPSDRSRSQGPAEARPLDLGREGRQSLFLDARPCRRHHHHR